MSERAVDVSFDLKIGKLGANRALPAVASRSDSQLGAKHHRILNPENSADVR
jgi:hypothetical protein